MHARKIKTPLPKAKRERRFPSEEEKSLVY
jgi:hypothetical protein